MHGLFRRRYPNYYDEATTGAWVAEVVLTHPLTFYAVRTDDAFLIALLTTQPWTPNDPVVFVVTVACDHGHVFQVVPLLRASIAWARSRRATSWRFQSDTGADIGALMRRVGAREERRYRLDLGGDS